MPIYEYMCAKCGEFETTQRITDEPLKRCPTCRSKVKKLISNTTFQLKGSGWYITDYGRKDGGAGKDGDQGKSDTSPKSESTSSEASSDTKSTDKKAAKKAPSKKEGAKASGGAKAA